VRTVPHDGPTIDAIATDYNGRVRVGKLNVDDNGNVATRYGIRGIPTLLLFKGGRVVEQRVGPSARRTFRRCLTLIFRGAGRARSANFGVEVAFPLSCSILRAEAFYVYGQIHFKVRPARGLHRSLPFRLERVCADHLHDPRQGDR